MGLFFKENDFSNNFILQDIIDLATYAVTITLNATKATCVRHGTKPFLLSTIDAIVV